MGKSEYDVVYFGFVLGHGGDALQMLTLAEGVQRSGLRVKVVVPRVPESVAFEERCAVAGVSCERSAAISAKDGARQSLPGLFRLLSANPAPLWHFHTGNSYLPRTLMVLLLLMGRRPAVATLQSPWEVLVPGSFRARTWAWLANRRLEAVISPSEHGSRFQNRCGVDSERTMTIRNAVDITYFSAGDPTGPRAVLSLNENDHVVLFCSRIDPQKRPVDAVGAFARVFDRFPRAHLVFVGSGAEEPSVREAIDRLGTGSRTHLVGYQTNVADWLALATVWFLPTERENFSVAVLEALAAGCAVLSTDCPGNDEVLVNDENAMTFPVGDVGAAADSLAKLLSDAELRAQLARGARTTAARYSEASLVSATRTLYARLVPRWREPAPSSNQPD